MYSLSSSFLEDNSNRRGQDLLNIHIAGSLSKIHYVPKQMVSQFFADEPWGFCTYINAKLARPIAIIFRKSGASEGSLCQVEKKKTLKYWNIFWKRDTKKSLLQNQTIFCPKYNLMSHARIFFFQFWQQFFVKFFFFC